MNYDNITQVYTVASELITRLEQYVTEAELVVI